MGDDWHIFILGGQLHSDRVLVLRCVLVTSTGLQGLLSWLGLSMPNELMVSLKFQSCSWKLGPPFSSVTGFFCPHSWGALIIPQEDPHHHSILSAWGDVLFFGFLSSHLPPTIEGTFVPFSTVLCTIEDPASCSPFHQQKKHSRKKHSRKLSDMKCLCWALKC